MMEGNYLDQHKEAAGGSLCYIDYKRKAFISAFCVNLVTNLNTAISVVCRCFIHLYYLGFSIFW